MLRGNKAQTEIIGLLLVVLIIIFAIVLSLVFFAKPKSFLVGSERILASNWVEATLAMHTPCVGRTVEDLLKDCAQIPGGTLCPVDASGRRLGTCETAKLIINDLLAKTFGEWKTKHRLLLNKSSELQKLEFPCNFKKCNKYETIVRNVPVSGGQEFVMSLQICRDIPDPKEAGCP